MKKSGSPTTELSAPSSTTASSKTASSKTASSKTAASKIAALNAASPKTTASKAATASKTATTSTAATASKTATAAKTKPAPKGLPIISDDDDFSDNALSAAWPEAVLVLSDDDRERRVRRGLDTVLLEEVDDSGRRTRGFVRAVLRVPLDHPKARVYGVFVEVDRAGYVALQRAFAGKAPARVRGRLATRLPFLDDAYGTAVEVLEDGSDNRARVVEVEAISLRDGPVVGPRVRRPTAP